MWWKMKRRYRSIKRGIKNVIRWLPVIWEDRDYDYYFLYTMLHKKLESMEKFFRSDYAWSKDHLKVAHQIMIAKNLVKRLMDDNYLENATVPYNTRFEPYNPFETAIEDKDGCYTILPDPDSERSEYFSRCCKHAYYMQKQDIDMLFSHMAKHIKAWWD